MPHDQRPVDEIDDETSRLRRRTDKPLLKTRKRVTYRATTGGGVEPWSSSGDAVRQGPETGHGRPSTTTFESIK